MNGMQLEEFEFCRRSRSDLGGYTFELSHKGRHINIFARHMQPRTGTRAVYKYSVYVYPLPTTNWLFDSNGDLIKGQGNPPPTEWRNFHNFFDELCRSLDAEELDPLMSVLARILAP